jgi:hypothetical protein
MVKSEGKKAAAGRLVDKITGLWDTTPIRSPDPNGRRRQAHRLLVAPIPPPHHPQFPHFRGIRIPLLPSGFFARKTEETSIGHQPFQKI